MTILSKLTFNANSAKAVLYFFLLMLYTLFNRQYFVYVLWLFLFCFFSFKTNVFLSNCKSNTALTIHVLYGTMKNVFIGVGMPVNHAL
jgi:hypothetical protein